MIENGWQDLTGSDKPTKEFLDRLLLYAKWYGWRGDLHEIFNFIDALRLEAGMKPLCKKEMVPFPNDDPPDLDEASDEMAEILGEDDNGMLEEESDDAPPRIR